MKHAAATAAPYTLLVSGVEVVVTRKAIRTLRLRLCPPDGSVAVSAPSRLPESAIRAFVTERLEWIRSKRAEMRARSGPAEAPLQSGATRMLGGVLHAVVVLETTARPSVAVREPNTIEISVRPGSDNRELERMLDACYREYLREMAAPLLKSWAARMGVEARWWGIKKMKTRWGTCNTTQHRIWLNLELAKKDRSCVEYLVVHELVHLLERGHNARFYGFMDTYLPDWRARKQRLNAAGMTE